MEMIFWIQYCISGLLLTIVCIIGLLGNTLTLYILNVNEDMRKQSINIYLTVLALYDNGVLLFGILMLGVPALYQNPSQLATREGTSSEQLSSMDIFNTNESYSLNAQKVAENCNKSIHLIRVEMTFFLNDSEIYDNKACNQSSDENTSDNPFYSPMQHYIRIVYPLALISQTGSIWTTCLITVERYFAVCHPLRALTLSTRSRAIWALTTLSIGAFIYNLPRFAEIDEESVTKSALRQNKIYYWFYYIVLNFSLIHVIPLSLLSVLNTKIYFSVRLATNNRSELTRARQRELNLASMLTLLVAIFIACNAPAFVINCLELIRPEYMALPTMFSNVLVCLNSAINFLIYCIFGKRFREKLKAVFNCSKKIKRRKSSANRQHYYFGGSVAADTYV